MFRDTTEIGSATSTGSRTAAQTVTNTGGQQQFTYAGALLDSPSSTSAITYHGTFLYGAGAGHTLYNQRTSQDSDTENYERATSTIILEEIAG